MKKKNKTITILIWVFTIIGALMFSAGIAMIIHGKNVEENWDTATATVCRIDSEEDSDGDIDYTVYVDYTYGGQTFYGKRLNSYSSSMRIGNSVPIYVNPENPSEFESPGTRVAGFVMGGLGIGFSAIGVWLLVRRRTHDKKLMKLKQTGMRISAVVEQIEYNMNVTTSGAHPFVVHCSYYDAYQNVKYCFQSNNVWEDPTLAYPVGSPISVYVDPRNMSKYYVDVDLTLGGQVVHFGSGQMSYSDDGQK